MPSVATHVLCYSKSCAKVAGGCKFEEPDEIIILNSNFDNKIDLIMMMKDKDRFDHAFLGSSRIPEFLYRGKFLFPT